MTARISRRAALAAPALLLGPRARAAGLDSITISYGQTTLYNSPMWIAKERDLFGKHGLKAELVQLTGSRITQGLLARSVDFIASSVSSPFLANLSGGDVLVVGANLKRLPWDFVTRPGIADIHALKGTIGGLALRGDLTETAILLALQTNAMAASDVTLIQGFGTDAERIAALLSGSVSFTVVDADYRPEYEKAGVQRLFSMMDVQKSFLVSAIITTRSYARAKPDVVRRYVMAISEALAAMHADKDFTLQVAGKYSQRPPAGISPSYDIYIPYIQRIPAVDRADVASSLEALANINPKAREADPAAYFDPGIVQGLVDAGFYRQIGAETAGR